MMKIDTLLLMQIIITFICVISILVYVNSIYRKTIQHFNDKFLKYISIEALGYLKKLNSKDYIVYEKYEIWRYCVHF
jgi:hypothetical protein